MTIWAIVPAGGAGSRMGGGTPKQFLPLGGRPLLVRTLETLLSWPRFAGAVVVAPEAEVPRTRGLLEGAGVAGVLRVVAGGATRQDSVRRGVEALAEAGPDDLVFVHDGVRPFPPVERFPDLAAAARPDGAILAVACRDTVKREENGSVAGTVDRAGLWQAQTPQVFPLAVLREALDRGAAEGRAGTDEASLAEALGRRPRLVPGDPRNLKVTCREDLELAEVLLSAMGGPEGKRRAGLRDARFHVGHGYDVHRLVAGRPLILGGVELPHERGLLGHSDADVLAHAVADACLGAAGLGDLGRHFPDTDPAWEGVSSLRLLEQVSLRVHARGLEICRVDATLVAQRPKVSRHVAAMEANLSGALGLPERGVTVKATTTEGLGFEGRQEGISAHAVALLGERGR
ncbi:MAG: 2-C-methyl-D-erythritol 4-phosphate cytidylyltransferase [Deferrisomatales bacterium]|nr:2-C-methyl-D-erythritol 4-phosphate cytidylyltransferase [Deferrisomatales bacterium]